MLTKIVARVQFLKNKMYAGVLPYAEDEAGSRWYLLGQENRGSARLDQWSDFGGGAHHPGDIARSAAEELYEESMGVFGSPHELVAQLRSRQKARLFKLDDGQTFVYLWRIPFDRNLPKLWNRIWAYVARCAVRRGSDQMLVIETCPEGFLEKKRIAWFPENELVAASRAARGNPRFRPPFLRTFAQIRNLAANV